MTIWQNVDLDELARIKSIASSTNDGPVLMLNLNRYLPEAGFPDGTLYKAFLVIITKVVNEVGGKILWRTTVRGHIIGNQEVHEALGIWYPTHQAFLDLMSLPDFDENMRLRSIVIEEASQLCCDAY
jgi:hypothetical protein